MNFIEPRLAISADLEPDVNPKHRNTACRLFVKQVWPAMEVFLRQLMNGEKLGNSDSVGHPFCKAAWVDRDGCFLSKKQVMGPYQHDPAIVVEISIFPNPYQYEFDPRPIKPKE